MGTKYVSGISFLPAIRIRSFVFFCFKYLYLTEQSTLQFGQSTVVWDAVGGQYSFVDFTMPGTKGYFIKSNGEICIRSGISSTVPFGNGYECAASSDTLQDFSCGVTGCFGLIEGFLYFRQGRIPNV